MDDLNANFAYISLNDHNHTIIADPTDYQTFICASYASQPHIVETQSVPLYAPIPSQGQEPAFMSPHFVFQHPSSFDGFYNHQGYFSGSESFSPESSPSTYEQHQSPDDCSEFCDDDSFPSTTFPTPSELLAELAENGLPHVNRPDQFATDGPSESTSKARRRSMARSVGFIPTDPDSISSHEKKRHYLATLEEYVLFLSEQLKFAGMAPEPMLPVPSSKGLTSQSIRILLVHMENVTRELNYETLANEQKYLDLSESAALREAQLLGIRQ